jgi:hypothetical protein
MVWSKSDASLSGKIFIPFVAVAVAVQIKCQ